MAVSSASPSSPIYLSSLNSHSSIFISSKPCCFSYKLSRRNKLKIRAPATSLPPPLPPRSRNGAVVSDADSPAPNNNNNGRKAGKNEVARAIESREIVTSLGPAYIKLEQAPSIRSDILSPTAMTELQKLCDKCSGQQLQRMMAQLCHYHCHVNLNVIRSPFQVFKAKHSVSSAATIAGIGSSLSSVFPHTQSSVSGVLLNYYCSRSNKYSRFVVKATKTDSSSSGQQQEDDEGDNYEEYEVEIEQPYGLKFAKGRDGATYIDAIAPGYSADKTGKFSVGDKVIATSAVFGTEIWPAAEYGRTMYTIRQRIGPLYMKMQKRFGKMDYAGEMSEKEIIRAERNSGVISNRVREIQLQNYQRKMEQKQRREMDLREGLQLYKNGKYEEAREKFESVLGSSPTPDEASVASYNVACCYAKLEQIQAGLSALEDALETGYEDFKRIRTDPDLANLRTTNEFEALMKRFDESFINENAINAIKSIFGIFKK